LFHIFISFLVLLTPEQVYPISLFVGLCSEESFRLWYS